MSRIEQVISEIEDYIEERRPPASSASKIIVQKEESGEKLSELRMAIPEELGQNKKILGDQNVIMLDAQARYNTVVNEASRKTEQLVNQPEIVQKTTATANGILQNARTQVQGTVDVVQAEANSIRPSSIQYTDELLLDVQSIVGNASREANAKGQALRLASRQSFGQIAASRQRLAVNNETAQAVERQQ